MSNSLKNRSFLTILDVTPKEINSLLDLCRELKAAKRKGEEGQLLKGKTLALLFDKPALQARFAFEVAVFDQGGQVSLIDQVAQMGETVPLADIARFLGRTFHGLVYGGSQNTLDKFAKNAGVPVWNAFTDEFHPTQALADLFTMTEHCDKPLKKMTLCYLGDAGANIANSLMVIASKMGLDYRVAAPKPRQPKNTLLKQCSQIARETGAKITITENIEEAVKGADFLYTGVWAPMGAPVALWNERIKALKPYQVNQHVMTMAKNPKVRFMHCLPAFHNRETKIGEMVFREHGLEAMEVTDDVFESQASIVFDQAENSVHAIKALLLATLV